MINEKKKIKLLLKEGRQHQKENPEKALKIFNNIIKIDPTNFEVWGLKGESLILMKRYEEAIEPLKKGLELNPKDIYAAYILGSYFESKGKLELALEYYEKTIEINDSVYPKVVERRNNLIIKLGLKKELLKPSGEPPIFIVKSEPLYDDIEMNITDELELVKIESHVLQKIFHHSLFYGGLIGEFKMVIGELGGRPIDNELYIGAALAISVGDSHEVKPNFSDDIGKRSFFFENIMRPRRLLLNGWYCSIPLDGQFFNKTNFDMHQQYQYSNSKGCVIVIYPQHFFEKNYESIFEVFQLKNVDSEDYSRSAWKKIDLEIIDSDFKNFVNNLEEEYREFMYYIESKEIEKENLRKSLNRWLDFEYKEYYFKNDNSEYLNDLIKNTVLSIEKLHRNAFRVNDYIVLRLENDQTSIYVDNRFFNQCKYLLLNISLYDINSYREINSIDEAATVLDRSMEGLEAIQYNITPDVEFWGHCSNLQAWAEFKYDTRILHRNLAFPLLKRLTEVGDPIAKKLFKEEIAKRYKSGFPSVVKYLEEEGYLNYLSKEEIESLN